MKVKTLNELIAQIKSKHLEWISVDLGDCTKHCAWYNTEKIQEEVEFVVNCKKSFVNLSMPHKVRLLDWAEEFILEKEKKQLINRRYSIDWNIPISLLQWWVSMNDSGRLENEKNL